MVKYLTIPDKEGIKHYYDIKFNEYTKRNNIYLKDVCFIQAYKHNDHNYELRAFSYIYRHIVCVNSINSKKKLIDQIELFLKNYVYPDFEDR